MSMSHLDPQLLISIFDRTTALLERGWCQLNYARDAYGIGVMTDNPDARQWCLIGATDVVLRELRCPHLMPRLIDIYREALPPPAQALHLSPQSYNDQATTTQANVLALVRRARAAVKT